jgi:fructose-specific phosphotransferase system IIA component
MDIFSLLDPETVLPNLKAKNKADILEKLVSSLSYKLSEEEIRDIYEAILEREQIMSTGVGKGLAIPHGKTSTVDQTYAAFAILNEPVDYDAIDDKPVDMVFLLVGPQNSNSMHIKLLSRISRLMNNSRFRAELRECTSAEEIIDQFKKEEHVSLSG